MAIARASEEVPSTSASSSVARNGLFSIFSAELEGSKRINQWRKITSVSPHLNELLVFSRQREIQPLASLSEALEAFVPKNKRAVKQKHIRDIIAARRPAVQWELKMYTRRNKSAMAEWAKVDDTGTRTVFNQNDWLVTDILSFSRFNDHQYSKYLDNPNWTKEETLYLMNLFRHYSIRWAAIADAYNFRSTRRNIFEIKDRIHEVVRCQKYLYYLERLPNKTQVLSMMVNDSDVFYSHLIDRYNSCYFRQKFGFPNTHTDFLRRLSEIDLAAYKSPDPPPPPPKARNPTSSVVSSSASPAATPQPKAVDMQLCPVKYGEYIESALDTVALRFFAIKLQGISLRSQASKLLSNVNQRKRANIEQVVQHLGIATNIHTKKNVVGHVKLAKTITQISELKGLFLTVQTELSTLRKNYLIQKDRKPLNPRDFKIYDLKNYVTLSAKQQSIIKLSETAITVATQLKKNK